jgi:hypothetical protein
MYKIKIEAFLTNDALLTHLYVSVDILLTCGKRLREEVWVWDFIWGWIYTGFRFIQGSV